MTAQAKGVGTPGQIASVRACLAQLEVLRGTLQPASSEVAAWSLGRAHDSLEQACEHLRLAVAYFELDVGKS